MSNKPIVGSLSAKKLKKKGKKVTRNVLTLSKDAYWPEVPDKESLVIENILKEHLSIISLSKHKIPWYILMKMTKEQRKEKQRERIESLTEKEITVISTCKEIRKHLIIGINSSIRSMEQGTMAFCLIDSAGEPKILLEKLLALAEEKEVLAALVPDLKAKTKAIMGFSSFILGFKVSIMEEMCGIKGCLKIKEILKKLNLVPPAKGFTKDYEEQSFSKLNINQERLSEIYLYRTSNHERVFRPKTISSVQSPQSDFIGVSDIKTGEVLSKKMFKRYTDHSDFETCEDSNSSRIFDSPLILTLQNNPSKRKKK